MAALRLIGALAAAALFLGAAAPGGMAAAAGDGAFFRPLRTVAPPAIDGRLEDAVWREAPSVELTKTFIPDFGREASERTVAFMAYDAENLYFAFKCYDREPDKIKAALADRDTIRSDDFICINLDSFNDRQSLYALYVNPLGIQTDSRYASGNEDFSVDFVWSSAGRIDPDGYSVELAVPFKSIRFAGKKRVEMSIFFERRVSRRSEHCSYPALDPARGYAFLTQMMPLELEDIRHYTLLEVLPAYTFRDGAERVEGVLAGAPAVHDGHLTGKYGITSQLILDGTYNPDFSQIEADAGQVDVNLRYDLFFPEKRPFFLEGSEMFQLAGTSDADPLAAVVHTRTIVDPRIGFKLSGKVGKKDTIASIFALDESPSTDPLYIPGTDAYAGFAVLRYKRAVASDGYLGAFYTGREYGGGFNQVAGADGQLRLSKASQMSFHGLGSWTKPLDGAAADAGLALGAEYLYDTRNIGVSISFYDISSHFQTDAGYLIRQGVAGLQASVSPRFYPKSRFFRKIVPDPLGGRRQGPAERALRNERRARPDGAPAREHDRPGPRAVFDGGLPRSALRHERRARPGPEPGHEVALSPGPLFSGQFHPLYRRPLPGLRQPRLGDRDLQALGEVRPDGQPDIFGLHPDVDGRERIRLRHLERAPDLPAEQIPFRPRHRRVQRLPPGDADGLAGVLHLHPRHRHPARLRISLRQDRVGRRRVPRRGALPRDEKGPVLQGLLSLAAVSRAGFPPRGLEKRAAKPHNRRSKSYSHAAGYGTRPGGGAGRARHRRH